MARKRKFEKDIHPADKYADSMKLKDLKRECVIRGLPFDQAIGMSIFNMMSWFRENFYNKIDTHLLNKFDDWQEEEILKRAKEKGINPEYTVHPSLRLGYIAERDGEGNIIKRKNVKMIIKRKKVKRERTKDNLFSGTKKAYTYELQQNGKTKQEVIKLVMEKFPEASEKSIGIWFNKSKKIKK